MENNIKLTDLIEEDRKRRKCQREMASAAMTLDAQISSTLFVSRVRY